MSATKTRPDAPATAKVNGVTTPALIWDLDVLDRRADALARFATGHGCTLLYSVKAAGVGAVLRRLAPQVAGFACSSPFEARLAREVLGSVGEVHLTSPALSAKQCGDAATFCSHVTFNSLRQWRQMHAAVGDGVARGIRINPGLSIVSDPRFDPCRPGSKLGVPIADLAKALTETPEAAERIDGLHVHMACGSRSFRGLEEAIAEIETALPDLLPRLNWFNLGGGFLYDKIRKSKAFGTVASRLRDDYGLQVFIEPGTAMVQNAAMIVASVVDIMDSGDTCIAVLDTSVNHMPEVFAYQFQPPIKEARRGAPHTFTLAGATCLAGDIIGTYDFDAPLDVGDRVTIEKMGAYTHGQSHWFNGVNLPDIYTIEDGHGLVRERAFGFDDFAARCAFT